jgi:feruloyl esterase
MGPRLRIFTSILWIGALTGLPGMAHAQTACMDLVGKKFAGSTILESEIVPPGTQLGHVFGGKTSIDAPMCRVRAQAKPTADSDIRFDVWLPEPSAWNGRYQGVGGGGNGGSLALCSMKNAIAGGYAVSAQDSGHIGKGDDSTFAVGHPEKVIDFGWRSLFEVGTASKAIVADYYGRAADLSLWNGCSTGGRQGLALAERYPDMYDGIAVGAPANYWPELNAMHAEFGRYLLANPEGWVSPEQAAMIGKKVAEACGASDGFVEDPLPCKFDYASLQRRRE